MRKHLPELGYERNQVGQAIRQVRLSKDLTQAEVAWAAGITQAALSNYENGKRDIPLPALITICRAMGTYPAAVVPGLIPPPGEDVTGA
jgi:transcriptional regulator with XRE-family HTH domain